MLAGPTEVLVIADDAGDVRAVAADLIAQAEHDEDASAWCVTTSARLADALPGELARQVARSPRRVIVERSGSEEHTSELQSQSNLVCRLLLEKKKQRCLTATPTSTDAS